MSRLPLNYDALKPTLREKVIEAAAEPGKYWSDGFTSYLTDPDGAPSVRIGLVNFDPKLDIWASLRGPSRAGRHPIGPEDIWNHYAANNIQRTRYDGSANAMALPETYDEALERFKRVVILVGMLPLNPDIQARYAEKIKRGDQDPYDYYPKAGKEAVELIDRAMAKMSFALMGPDRAIAPMTTAGAQAVIDNCRSEYQKGSYHGPCNNNWPHNSVAVMSGLLRFGVHHLPFRDEVGPDGRVRRLYGRYRSIVIFDEQEPVDDPAAGMNLLTESKINDLITLGDYRQADPATTGRRYCTYNRTNSRGETACGLCLRYCPSGALANSAPDPDGVFPEKVAEQKHRFADGWLKFDYANCTSDRYQKARLYEDYVCARCEAICAAAGVRKSADEVNRINN